MSDTGKERRIAVRPVRLRKPMKTRMFDAHKIPEFVWKYDAYDPESTSEYTIESWFERWKANDFNKLPIPGSK